MTKSNLKGDEYISRYGDEEYVRLVSIYSIFVGMASFLLSITGLVKYAQSIPKPITSGFKWGVAMGVLCAALPNGLLLHGKPLLDKLVSNSKYLSALNQHFSSTSGIVIVSKILFLISNPYLWSIAPTFMFLLGVIFIMTSGKYFTKYLLPGLDVIIVTTLATLFSYMTNYEGVTIGEIPIQINSSGFLQHLIPFEILDYETFPKATKTITNRCFNGSFLYLLTSSSIFAFVNFLSIVSVAYLFETENHISWTTKREMNAQGFACIMAGVSGSAPVGGSFSRSLVSRMTGATSSLSCIITALCWIYLLPFMTFMSCTPKAALSSIIVSAVIKSVIYPKDLLSMKDGYDRLVGWYTAIVTTLTSPTIGFMFGLILWNVTQYVTSRYQYNELPTVEDNQVKHGEVLVLGSKDTKHHDHDK